VTVSNDEVAAVVVKYRIADRVRQSFRSISSKLLQPLAGRHRSRSIGDADVPPITPASPAPSTAASTTRRRSILGFRQTDDRPDNARSFSVNKASTLLLAPSAPGRDPLDKPIVTSSTSLEKLRLDTSPPEIQGSRERSVSNASGFGLSGKLIRMISRTSSQRSRFRRQGDSAELDETMAGVTDRLSLDDGLPRRSIELHDAAEPVSVPSPERYGTWESRMKRHDPIRRGSNLSEDFTRGVQEEVDWDEALSDEEEYIGQPIQLAGLPAAVPPTPRSPSRSSSRLSHSPLRPMHIDRARSPLRAGQEVNEDDDQGLAFSIGSKRGRRASILEKAHTTDR
jgi:hypothetical protein